MAFFSWYLILKHRSFSYGATPAARLVNPSSRVLSSDSPAPVFDILVLVALSKIFATSLLGACQTGFHFSSFLDLCAQRLPFEMVYQGLQVMYPTDRREAVTGTQVYFFKASPVGFEL